MTACSASSIQTADRSADRAWRPHECGQGHLQAERDVGFASLDQLFGQRGRPRDPLAHYILLVVISPGAMRSATARWASTAPAWRRCVRPGPRSLTSLSAMPIALLCRETQRFCTSVEPERRERRHVFERSSATSARPCALDHEPRLLDGLIVAGQALEAAGPLQAVLVVARLEVDRFAGELFGLDGRAGGELGLRKQRSGLRRPGRRSAEPLRDRQCGTCIRGGQRFRRRRTNGAASMGRTTITCTCRSAARRVGRRHRNDGREVEPRVWTNVTPRSGNDVDTQRRPRRSTRRANAGRVRACRSIGRGLPLRAARRGATRRGRPSG